MLSPPVCVASRLKLRYLLHFMALLSEPHTEKKNHQLGKKNCFHNLSCSQVEVSPLENAIEVIENKNLQLRTLITQCQSRQMQNINPLTMCLNGVIDAAVNGGLARYQEVRKAQWRMMPRWE